MKKFTLIAAASLAFAVANATPIKLQTIHLTPQSHPTIKADTQDSADEFTFSYAQGYSDGIGTGSAKIRVGGAMEIPASLAAQWEGYEIKQVNIGFGTAAATQPVATLFITDQLDKTPTYTQSFDAEVQNWNDIVLDTPYKIEGKSFYVGYEYTTTAATDYPIGVDGVATTNPGSGLLGINGNWSDYGADFGSVSIELVISGGQLPEYGVLLSSIKFGSNVTFGKTFSVTIPVTNIGSTTFKSTDLSISVKINDKPYESFTYSLRPTSVSSGATSTLTIQRLLCEEEGIFMPLEVTINEIAGNTVNQSTTNVFSCLSEGAERNVVVEEWTGTWCGWCPLGIVGMEYMEENYGNEGFIGIAIHGGNNDPMEIASYNPVVDLYSGGSYPGCIVNRTNIVQPYQSTLQQQYKLQRALPAIATVALSASYDESKPDVISATATTSFIADANNVNCRLAFVITENNVGPYRQSNYFAGGSQGVMGGWEKLGSSVSTIYNEVARDIVGPFGIEGSVPSSVEKDAEYTYTVEIPTTNVYEDPGKCTVIALLINGITGEIENAAKVDLGDASVGSIVADNSSVAIRTTGDSIVIDGDFSSCDIYSVDGKLVVSATNNTVALTHGLYVVKVVATDGSVHVAKVAL